MNDERNDDRDAANEEARAAAEALDEEVATIEQTAPDLPWEITLKNSGTYYQKLPGGRMILKFVPVVLTPQGPMMAPPGVEVVFSADGWERFKDEVARDGERRQFVETAQAIPAIAIPGKRR